MPTTYRSGLLLCIILALSLLAPQPSGSASPSPLMTIQSPGNGSAVTAPIQLTGQIQPGGDQLVRITLIDENNNMLTRQLKRVEDSNGQIVGFTTWLNFEIPTETIEALLILETQDAFHRPLALRSVFLSLLSEGPAVVEPNHSAENWVNILSPQPLETYSGGEVFVEGSISPVTEKPIIFELVTDTGGVIGSSQLAVTGKGETFSFEFILAYSFISTERDVRMVIRQTADPYRTNVVLDSVPIILTP